MRHLIKVLLCGLLLLVWLPGTSALAGDYDVRIIGGVNDYIGFWKEIGFWGAEDHGKDFMVPRAFTVGSRLDWKSESDKLPVETKKELFYRAALPLIALANELITRDRERLLSISGQHEKGQALNDEDQEWLRRLAARYRLVKTDQANPMDAEILAMLGELKVRVDIIPASLALGQSAYESGYDTSRFAKEGNAFFGQWTWSKKGLRPLEQRGGKGDYKVASYDWPLDSVREYMRNLNTQRTYEELRSIRTRMRQNGQAPSGYEMAAGLGKYSEKGQEYIDTLRGIMKKNKLLAADRARLRDGRPILLFEAANPDDKIVAEKEINALKTSGDLNRIIQSMRLDEGV